MKPGKHRNPGMQDPPAQQGWESPPHVAGTVHVPEMHVSPPEQLELAQHN